MGEKSPTKGREFSTSPKKTPTSPKKSPNRFGMEKTENDGIKRPTSNPGPDQRRKSQNIQRRSADSSKWQDIHGDWLKSRKKSQDSRKPSIDSPYGNPENQNLNMSGNIAHNTKSRSTLQVRSFQVVSSSTISAELRLMAKEEHSLETPDIVVFSEFVKFVVVAQFYNHCVALPLHTYEGKGLTNKIAYKNDFIPIRTKGSDYQNTVNNYGILDIIPGPIPPGKEDTWSHVIVDNTYVHFTAPYSHSCLVRSQLLGKLTEDSLRKLKMLYGQSVLFKLGMERYENGELRNLLKLEHKNFTVPSPDTTRLGPQIYVDTKPRK